MNGANLPQPVVDRAAARRGNAAMASAEHDASPTSLHLSFTGLMDTDMAAGRLGCRAAQAA